jgi:hypothetical protein
MQDGTFYAASQTISFGRAIFVFAGGISDTINEFDPFAEPPGRAPVEATVEITNARNQFRDQKGPDFVSRLRGHINILSVNPDKAAAKDDAGNPVKPIIRRALILRGQIQQGKWVVNRDGCKVASIDEDVLCALLTVHNYRHGVRSMEAILQMCTPIDGIIEKGSLPSRTQLNMHVDADDFFNQMHLSREIEGTRAPEIISPVTKTTPTASTDQVDNEAAIRPPMTDASKAAQIAPTKPAVTEDTTEPPPISQRIEQTKQVD